MVNSGQISIQPTDCQMVRLFDRSLDRPNHLFLPGPGTSSSTRLRRIKSVYPYKSLPDGTFPDTIGFDYTFTTRLLFD